MIVSCSLLGLWHDGRRPLDLAKVTALRVPQADVIFLAEHDLWLRPSSQHLMWLQKVELRACNAALFGSQLIFDDHPRRLIEYDALALRDTREERHVADSTRTVSHRDVSETFHVQLLVRLQEGDTGHDAPNSGDGDADESHHRRSSCQSADAVRVEAEARLLVMPGQRLLLVGRRCLVVRHGLGYKFVLSFASTALPKQLLSSLQDELSNGHAGASDRLQMIH